MNVVVGEQHNHSGCTVTQEIHQVGKFINMILLGLEKNLRTLPHTAMDDLKGSHLLLWISQIKEESYENLKN